MTKRALSKRITLGALSEAVAHCEEGLGQSLQQTEAEQIRTFVVFDIRSSYCRGNGGQASDSGQVEIYTMVFAMQNKESSA